MNEKEIRNQVISKKVGRNLFDTPPKISVIIPAYNSAEHIVDTLDSVIKQRFREHEIIVVNDGSPDTEQFERSIRSRLDEIVYIRQRNSGAGIARNTGLLHARASTVAFLDADDIWMPDFLASQYVFMGRGNYDMVYCDADLFGMRSAYRKTFMETCPSEGEADFDALLDLRCNVITSGTMARKQAIIDAGMFETARVRAHDFNLWLRMAKNGAKIGYQRKQLLKYRVHVDSLSGDAVSRAERDVDAFERVRRDIELTDDQARRVDETITRFKADLAVEQAKSYLVHGDYREAALAFRVANRYRRSVKLAAVSVLARVAPGYLLKHYRRHRAADIAFLPTHPGAR
jgi:glycosyltransferase involved in cell wall biosynthesis